jgi:DNA-binding transcriptional LysR family regulator
VELQVSVSNSLLVCQQISSGSLDCGLVSGPLPKVGLIKMPVAEDEVVLVARPEHPLAGLKKVGQKDLVQQRYLAREHGSATELVAAEMLGPAYGQLSKVQVASIEAMRQALFSGPWFAALPKAAVQKELSSDALVQLPVPARRRPIYAVRRPGRGSLALEAFWRMLASKERAGEPRPMALPLPA